MVLWLVLALREAVGWCRGGRGWVGAGSMSMRPVSWPEVPEQTAAVARAAFPKGSLAMRLRDELGLVFQDADFAGAFGARGRPGISPAVLMLVTVLQFVERLTDRQAVEAVAPDFLPATGEPARRAKRDGPRVCDWNWPRAKAQREELAERFGRDGRDLVIALFAQRQRPWLRELPQVALLCTVLRQNYLVETTRNGSEVMRRRTETDGVPPAPLRLASPY